MLAIDHGDEGDAFASCQVPVACQIDTEVAPAQLQLAVSDAFL